MPRFFFRALVLLSFLLLASCGGSSSSGEFLLGKDLTGDWSVVGEEYISKSNPSKHWGPFDFPGEEPGNTILHFGADGAYQYDYLPAEDYRDHIGTYSIDEANGVIHMESSMAALDFKTSYSDGQLFLEDDDFGLVIFAEGETAEPAKIFLTLEKR